MLPACIISTIGLWLPSCGESDLTPSVPPQHPAECRHSANAGLSMKLKMSRLAQPQTAEGGLCRHGSQLGAELAPGSSRKEARHWPCPLRGRERKGTEPHLPGPIFPPHESACSGQWGCLSACQRECRQLLLKSRGFRKHRLLRAGSSPPGPWSSVIHPSSSLTEFAVRLRLGHHS